MRLTRVALPTPPPWLPGSPDLSLPAEAGLAAEVVAPEQVDLSHVLEERYRTPRAPLTARLPFHYHRIPPGARRALARLLQLARRPASFPRRPFEPSVDAIRWWRGERARWPGQHRFAVLLTHDVDTARGLERVAAVAELERRLGVRSTFFLCSHHYELDLELLARLEQDGFEIGSHGYNHDNRLAFLADDERCARLDAIAGRFRPKIPLAGFRSPSLLRTSALLASLQGRFAYDSSIPDVDLEGEGGCATLLPYRIGKLYEIPITLPMESSLLYSGVRPAEIFQRWSEKLAWVRAVGGVATAVLHCEPQLGGHPELLRRYGEWVRQLALDAWVTTPRALIAQLETTGFFARGVMK